MPLRGDFSAFSKMADEARRLAEVPGRAATAAAPKVKALIDEAFATGTTADGSPMAPLNAKTVKTGRHPPPLTATGAAKGQTKVTASGTMVRGELAPWFMRLHTDGASHLPARPVVPVDGGELPPKYVAALTGACEESVKKLGGK